MAKTGEIKIAIKQTITSQDRDNFVNYVMQNIVPEYENKIDDFLVKYEKLAKEKWKEAADNIFYDQYTPELYSRTHDLYNAMRIRNDDELGIEVSPEFMENNHRVDRYYIYSFMYDQGYHGGAILGPNHPDPGTPYWRSPRPHGEKTGYYHWYMPAPNSGGNGIQRMIDYVQSYLDSTIDQLIEIIRNLALEIKREAQRRWSSIN